MTVDATRARARSFDAWAPDYERYRPGYPPALFALVAARLSLPDRPRVVDLGAGTGKATIAMAERGWSVTAVEPGGPMLAVLRRRAAERGLPVATVEAAAERTGLPHASFDLATAAQAFHWFEPRAALREMARIVRRGGGIAAFWNVRDEERSAFVADYHGLLDARFGTADTGRYLASGRPVGHERTRRALEDSAHFGGVERVEVRHEVEVTVEQFAGMAFTASYVRAAPSAEQGRFRQELAGLFARHGLAGRRFTIPYRVDVWIARRIDP
ncbi:MAG TPA: class I SAM-dependent methyltransferase [Candidatus Limnocylindria bacterium]|nr:class I SAM-dependent methyltransferase [Candidatus Limnocylindria bacterium]